MRWWPVTRGTDRRPTPSRRRRPIRPIACAVASAWLTVTGCAARQTQPVVPPLIVPAPNDGVLQVSLTWAAPVDLDLYVTDPAGESLYFGNRRTRAGGVLEDDARCDSSPAGSGRLEQARLPRAAAGRYRVGVDFIDTCGGPAGAVPFRVAVDRPPVHREMVGVARPGEFNVVVLEFDVGEDGMVREGAQNTQP
jgi:hypothetical protein